MEKACKVETVKHTAKSIIDIWRKARAVQFAAQAGFMAKEQEDALMAEAEAASKTMPQAVTRIIVEEDLKLQIEWVESRIKAACEQGFLEESVFNAAKNLADNARAKYQEAVQAAERIS